MASGQLKKRVDFLVLDGDAGLVIGFPQCDDAGVSMDA